MRTPPLLWSIRKVLAASPLPGVARHPLRRGRRASGGALRSAQLLDPWKGKRNDFGLRVQLVIINVTTGSCRVEYVKPFCKLTFWYQTKSIPSHFIALFILSTFFCRDFWYINIVPIADFQDWGKSIWVFWMPSPSLWLALFPYRYVNATVDISYTALGSGSATPRGSLFFFQ